MQADVSILLHRHTKIFLETSTPNNLQIMPLALPVPGPNPRGPLGPARNEAQGPAVRPSGGSPAPPPPQHPRAAPRSARPRMLVPRTRFYTTLRGSPPLATIPLLPQPRLCALGAATRAAVPLPLPHAFPRALPARPPPRSSSPQTPSLLPAAAAVTHLGVSHSLFFQKVGVGERSF